MAWWLDTLCVPVSKQHKKFRKLAMAKLRDTYMNAHRVLVLDARLQQVTSNLYERRLQLVCSEWMRRLWTLQEGMLPSSEKVYIQYSGEAVPLPALYQERLRLPDADLCSGLERATRRLLLERFNLIGIQGRDRLVRIILHLQARQTTKEEDEPVCLATLMGVDLLKFPGLPSLEQIFGDLPELPEDLIFAPGPRLPARGWRWAPSTFLSQSLHEFELSSHPGSLTTDGFKIFKRAIEFSEGLEVNYDDRANLTNRFAVMDPDSRRPTHTFTFQPQSQANLEPVAAAVRTHLQVPGLAALLIAKDKALQDGTSPMILVRDLQRSGHGDANDNNAVTKCKYVLRGFIRDWESLPPNYSLDEPVHQRVWGVCREPMHWCVD